ncbi:MAG TPA: hypothetical protein VHB53_03415 [Solirubrobacterales bacterium]|nr:hypothetical protein [Solirubrobacterales bacterium]
MAEMRGAAAVLAVVEEQRKALRVELRTLDSIASRLGGERIEETLPKPAAPKSRRRSQKGTKTNSPAAAVERREKLVRFLDARAEPVSSGVIQRELGFTQHNVKTAIKKLEDDGKVGRTGEGASTRYFLPRGERDAAGSSAIPPVASGTIPGRILERARDGVTPAELATDLSLPEDDVRKECGKLIVEEELRMARRGGERIYIVNGGA